MHPHIRFTIRRDAYDAVLFDLDGVVTRTAALHARAWKEAFDPFLRGRQEPQAARPFDIEHDYLRFVDGRPRYDGVTSFLSSRHITVPFGDVADAPGAATVCGLGNLKQSIFRRLLDEGGIEVYAASIDLIKQLRAGGFKTAVVSSSKNAIRILEAARIAHLFDVRIDGAEQARLGLRGKPAPDIFLEACRRLGVTSSRAIVVEDAVAGVVAAHRGRFGWVIGIDRGGNAQALILAKASTVVSDLDEIDINGDELPHHA